MPSQVTLPPRSFTFKYKGIVSVLKTGVEISQAFDLARAIEDHSSPPPPKTYTAIWDTGATNSCITDRVVSELELKPITIATIYTAAGAQECPVHLVCIGLPNKVSFTDVRVTQVESLTDADVLIGMDMISQGDFAVTTSDGKTTLSFRIPPTTCIDFVEEFNTSQQPGVEPVGRNKPCPCGSGKKYKYCHGRSKS